MGIMGVVEYLTASRYQHATNPIRRDVAARVGGLTWVTEELEFEPTETRAHRARSSKPEWEAFALAGWRRMRDSNPRGCEPNPLSKSALARFTESPDVHLSLRGVFPNVSGRPRAVTT